MLDVLLQLLQQQDVHEITKRGISVQRSEPLRNLLLRDAFRLSDIAQNALSKHVDLVDQKAEYCPTFEIPKASNVWVNGLTKPMVA